MTSQRPILYAEDLEQAEQRPLFVIGGREYELRSGNSVNMATLTRLGALSRELAEIDQSSPDATERVVANLRQTMRAIFYDDLPDEVLDGMSIHVMRGVADFFMTHSGIPELQGFEPEAAPKRKASRSKK